MTLKTDYRALVSRLRELEAERDRLENELCTAKDQIPPDLEGESLSVALIKLTDERRRHDRLRAALINLIATHDRGDCTEAALDNGRAALAGTSTAHVRTPEEFVIEVNSLEAERDRLRNALQLMTDAYESLWEGHPTTRGKPSIVLATARAALTSEGETP